MESQFDYIVIGGGSAGCAVAGRLADAGSGRVALLESGPHDKSALVTTPVAAAVTVTRRSQRNYLYRSEREAGLNGRRSFQPRGRGLGGSSSINGMIYIRGTPGDYDRWAALGCDGWAWQDVLPYFRRAECNERLAGRDDDALHGGHGPLHVSDVRSPTPFSHLFIEAAQAAGYPRNDDFNGPRQEGAGMFQVTQRNGERWNAARAYLHGSRGGKGDLSGGRGNLHVLTDTQVLRIVFDGKRAAGVAVMRDGREQVLRARREIILSAGAYGSPQLLMLSGIGPAGHLREHGIAVIHDAPEVGRNLQEHVDALLSARLTTADLFGISLRGGLRMAMELRRYYRRVRTGMWTSNLVEAGAFIKSQPELADPDLQLHFAPAIVDRKHPYGHGYSCHVCVLRPYSRGVLRLKSADPGEVPAIDLNMLSDERDMDVLVRGVRIVKRILDQAPLSRFGAKPLHHGHLAADGSDDDAIRAMIRQQADTGFHPVGTCRMGGDVASVVDPDLRVRGVEGLRVADASIMPTIIGGNTNAPAIMIGEKAADLILGRSGTAG
ncbi:GMC family oxidoreductase [Cupriavidus sp. M-11]|uniref:GMC family oxidoreductase n=1 Tax=Cupriavidus sp. M-11 TaxID=3233038 RepID=UPI003F8E4282